MKRTEKNAEQAPGGSESCPRISWETRATRLGAERWINVSSHQISSFCYCLHLTVGIMEIGTVASPLRIDHPGAMAINALHLGAVREIECTNSEA